MSKLVLRPPTHKIDAPGVFISTLDAWDFARIEADIAELQETELAKQVAAAEAKGEPAPAELDDASLKAVRESHPYVRYHEGHTRYQLDADDWVNGKPARARDFLVPDSNQVQFVLRRIPWKSYLEIQAKDNFRLRLAEFARQGVVEIRGGDDSLEWKRRDREVVPDHVLQSLHDAGCLIEVGVAAMRYSSELGAHEGKR